MRDHFWIIVWHLRNAERAGRSQRRLTMNHNLHQMAESLGLEEHELIEMLQLFLKSSRSDLNRLRAALQQQALPRALEATHSLKGVAINFGFQSMHQCCARLELNLQGGDWKPGLELTEEIASEFRRLAEVLEPDLS